MELRILLVGLGPIGVAIGRQICSRRGLRLVAAVDLDPAKCGRELRELVPEAEAGTRVEAELAAALASARPDVVVACTASSLAAAAPTFETCLAAGAAVVSTTEELSFPWRSQPDLAARLDAAAQRSGRALLGTGVNPGFAMDVLPLMMTAVCERVDGVTVRRVQDAGRRRVPFQRKIGAGLTPEEFEAGVAAGWLRHVGLAESIAMIGSRLGWELDSIEDRIEPLIAETPVTSGTVRVAAGQVRGLRQLGHGHENGRSRVRLEFLAAVGEGQDFDEVEIQGHPDLRSRIEGGIHGDIATASITVNTIPRVATARPGLLSMADLPPAACLPSHPAPPRQGPSSPGG